MSPSFLIASSHDPHETLALEEALLNHVCPGQIILYLYTHHPSVIIGRTQNAWAECHHERLLKDGGTLARRISGGGAVYHDPENLNFSFIAASDVYDVPRQLRVILAAVRSFGIAAEFSGRNDLLAADRKFSGNAFCVRSHGAFHHGTLMIDTNTENLQKYLNVPQDKIAAKGVKSVRSRVVNLRELEPALSQEQMITALRNAFECEYGSVRPLTLDARIQKQALALQTRNASWNWLFGKTPEFSVSVADRFPWGGIEIGWLIRNGQVDHVQVFSDSMQESLILQLAPALKQAGFATEAMQAALESLSGAEEERAIIADLQQLVARCRH